MYVRFKTSLHQRRAKFERNLIDVRRLLTPYAGDVLNGLNYGAIFGKQMVEHHCTCQMLKVHGEI